MNGSAATTPPGVNPVSTNPAGSAGDSPSQKGGAGHHSRLWLDILHLFVLSSFAVSQALYDHISRQPGLVAKYVRDFGSLLVLVLAISCLVPLILTVVELLAGLFGRAVREAVHVILVTLLLILLLLPAFNHFAPTWRAVTVLIAAFVLSAFAAYAYASFPRIKSIVTVAAPAILIFPGSFLWSSPVARTLLAQDPTHTTAGKPIPVVMVVFDEFCGEWLKQANQQIDASRYPNFAKLAATSNWYRNATAVHSQTLMAIPAILTGKRVRPDSPPVLAEHPYNLLDLMARSGSHEPVIFEPYSDLAPELHAKYFVESTSVLLPTYKLMPTLGLVFLQHICPIEERGEMPQIPKGWFGLHSIEDVNPLQRNGVIRWPWANHRDKQFEHFLSCIRPGPGAVNKTEALASGGTDERPQFLFIHAVLPHVPLAYLPSGRAYLSDSLPGAMTTQIGAAFRDTLWRKDELAVARAHQRYLLQIGYVDNFIGRLMARLREAGVFDECLLIVTADHGISFRPLLSRRHPYEESLPDLLSIPLFIKLPGQKVGRISDRNVESIDVLPTLAKVLELPLPIRPEGQSVLDENLPERPQKLMVNGAEFIIPAAFPSKQSAFDVLQRRFGTGTGWEGVYAALGPHQELVGRRVSDLPSGPKTGASMNLRLEAHSTHFSDSPRGLVPGYFAGWATPADPSEYPVVMAIAVNGVIRGVNRTYDFREENGPKDDSDRNRWEFFVPETAFRPGENQVQYFVVRGTGSQLTLHPIQN